MIGEVGPLKALQDPISSLLIIERVLREYPVRTLRPEETFYRIRKPPAHPISPTSPSSIRVLVRQPNGS
jgi:hypothetical protein